MIVATVLKLLVVLFFLVMFVRRPGIVWGVGLLTVTSAMLLDTILGTFNREAMLAQLGFFYYVISGLLLAGAAFWLWGLLRPRMPAYATPQAAPASSQPAAVATPSPYTVKTIPLATAAFAEAGYDRQMMFEQVHGQFGREDLNDLIFDLDLNEIDLFAGAGSGTDLVNGILDTAASEGKVDALALAVERITTPPTPDQLPRLEKLSAESPRPVLRYFLLSNYDLARLQTLANTLGIDWEQLPSRNKRDVVRGLLQYQYRHNDMDGLLSAMQVPATSAA